MKKFTTSARDDRNIRVFIPQLPFLGNHQVKLKLLLAGMGLFALSWTMLHLVLSSEIKDDFQVEINACESVYLEKAGIAISSPVSLGKTQIHIDNKSVPIEGKSSINRVVNIQPTKDRDLDASLDFYYEEPELGDLHEEKLILYSSTDGGESWLPHYNSVVDPTSNSIHLDGIGHFSLWTAGVPAEAMEENTVTFLTAFVVTTTADAGAGSLRQAITDVNAAGAGPHSITFDPGLSGQTITLASHLPVLGVSDVTIDGDIDGDGNGDITIDAGSGDLARYIFRGNANADNATFNGFTLQDTGYEPFRFDGSPTGVTLSNMIWRHTQNNWQNYGVYWVGNATDLTIRNVVMTQKQNFGGGAIYITGTATNVIIDNFDLSDSGGGGLQAIRIDGVSNNVTIKNCDLDMDLANNADDGDYGIWFRSTATNILIDSCTIHDAEIYPILFENVATDITISNSTLDNHDGYETVQMIRFNSTINGLIMTDVSIDCEKTDNGTNVNDGDYGIVFAGAINANTSKTAILTRVSVRAADLDNIYVNTTTHNLTLEECTITGLLQGHGTEDGIEFYNNVVRSNVVINNSTFDSNGRAGIIINCTNATSEFNITNNTITNNSSPGTGYGIWLWTGNGNKAIEISNNTIANNLSDGIVNNGPDGVNVTQNSIYNNGGLGLNNEGNSGNNDFEYNEGDVPYIISSVPISGNDYTVTYSLPSFCVNCDVEFFTNDPDDAMFQGRSYTQTESGLASGTHTAVVTSGGNNNGFWTATLKSNTHSGSVSEYSFQAAINPIGPGCVAAGIRLWLRADDVATGNIYTGGGWSDFSGNNYDFTLGGSDPNRVDGGLNFNHYVDFDANDHLYQPSFTYFFTSGEVFSVLQARTAGGGHAYNFGGQSNNHYRTVDTYESFGTNDRKGWRNTTNQVLDGSGVVVTPTPLFDPSEWNFYNVSADGVANNWKAFFNGFQKVNDASNVVNFADTYSRIGHGDYNYFDGNVSEVVLYNRALTPVERQRVNSYMAIKYGITMDQTNPTNYLAGDGSVIWPAGGGYDHDIAGIGQDDCQALNQKQSLSINSDAFVTIGLGTIAADNASNASVFAADKNFLIWGNDDAPSELQFSELPVGAHDGNQRLAREWKVAKTGTVGNVTVLAGSTNFSIPSGASNIEMYIDTDNDGNFTTGSPTVLTPVSVVDGVATFSGVSLNDGNLFTFGWFQIAPGCVGSNLTAWYKFDNATNSGDGSYITAISDVSGNALNLSSGTNTGYQPKYQANGLNFNPAGLFDGVNDRINAQHLEFIDDADPVTMITVSVPYVLSGERRTMSIGNGYDRPGVGFNGTNVDMRVTDVTAPLSQHSVVVSTNTPYIAFGEANNANPKDVRISYNGITNEQTFTGADGSFPAGGTGAGRDYIALGNEPNTYSDDFNGLITEAIIYNRQLSNSEKERLYSYLAVKYGITLSHNYYAGDWNGTLGTKIWDKAANAAFHNDIAGIGRDDCQALTQKQSKSANEDAILTMGLGAIAADNASNANTFSADRSFMLWGNDNGSLSADLTALPNDVLMTPTLQGLNVWLDRKWVIEETGTVGTVKASFDFTSFSNVYLITADDATFSSGVTYTAMTKVGDIWEGDYDFMDGQYFTLAGTKTGPGCVVADLQLWLKADNGLAVDGSLNATNWVDQSGNSRDANLIFGDPQRVDGSLNFNPVIDFDGNDYFRFGASPFVNGFSAAEVIVVVKDDAYTACNCGNPYDLGGSSRGFHYTWSNGSVYQGSFTNNRLAFNPLANTITEGKPGVASITGAPVDTRNWNIYGTHGAPNDWGVQFNGEFKALTSTNTFNTNLAAGNEHIGAVSGTVFNGDIAEVIMYNRVLTAIERQQVNSYLGVKYGLTLSHDYLAGDGATIWDLTENSSFNNDIAGIGKDICQNLSQKQSKSISDDAILSMGLGTIATDNKSNTNIFPSDKSFMLWGNNDGALDVDVAPLPGSSPPLLNVWLERKWLVQESANVVDDVRVRFEYYRFSNVYLVTADDEAFTTNVTYTPMTEVGVNWETDYDFADGQYFTIAGKVTSPGGVAASLELWVKANGGTSSTVDNTAITTWKDLSGNNRVMAVTAAGREPFYRTPATGSNFNPFVNFDGSNDGLEIAPLMTGMEPGGSVFGAASNKTPGTGYDNLVVFGIDNPHLGTAVTTGKPLGYMNGSSPIRADHPTVATANKFHIWSWEWDMANEPSSTSSNTGLDVIFDGEVYTEPTMEMRESSFANGAPAANEFQIGSYEAAEPWDGPIGEVAVYSRNLTPAESQKVNSYFSIKWGTTLDSDPASATVNYDYVDSDGNVLWSGTSDATYQSFHHDIGGIGRDDDSGLSQKQSKSINDGEILIIGNGTIAATNFANTNSFSQDESFMLWGNNDGVVDADTLAIPAGAPAGVNNWLARKWRVAESGAVGNVRLSFEYTRFSNVYLVTASDASFTSGVTYTPMAQVGDNWEVTYDLSDGEYFTLAGYAIAPGCVTKNLQLWLKADYTSSEEDGNLTNWEAFGGNPDFEFAYTNSDPQFQDGVLNFNPVVNFDGDDFFRTDPGAGTLNYTSDFTAGEVFTVVRTTANNGSPYDFGGNSNTHYLHTNQYIYNDFGTTVRKAWQPQTLAVLEGGGTVVGPPVDATKFQIFHSYSAPGDWASGFNGDFAYTTSSNVVSFAPGAGGNHIGAGSGGFILNGDIGEVVLYDRKLTAVERQKVVSYLAIKYGMELTDDYLAGDGTTVWTSGGGYDNDIAGIGRDDCQTLNQKQSKSINEDSYVTIGHADIALTNNANTNNFTSDKSFMLWGNNDGVKGFVTPFTGTMLNRMDRVWKVEENGTVGTVKVFIPFSNVNNLVLVRSTDATFDNTDDQIAMTCDENGCYAMVDFANGDFFTFAGMVGMPFSNNFNDQFDGLLPIEPATPPTRCSPNFWEREALYENTYTGGPGDKITPGVSANETTHLADVDNDGDLDIVWLWDAGMVTPANAGVYIWKSNGDGTFETGATTFIGSMMAEDLPNGSNGVGLGGVNATESTHVADVNGDGNVDLIWMGEAKNKTYVWLGKGDGTWDDVAIEQGGYTGGVSNKITPGITGNESTFLVDVNTDGILDMVWVYDLGAVNAGGVYIWLGNGDGTWQTAAIVDVGSFTGTPGHYMGGQTTDESTHLADFTGDGVADIMWLWGANRVSYVWPGNGDGTFQHTGIVKSGYNGGPTNDFNVGYSANETTHIADVDNDGKLDIVSTYDAGLNPALAGVYIWYGLGDGTFATTAKADKGAFTYNGAFNGTSSIALGGQSASESSHVADLNGDGAVDLMWLYETNNASFVWLSTDEDNDGISDNTDADDDDDGIADVSDPCESPGGVIADLALWLRSDAGTSTTTSGNTLEIWEDQGPEGYNAAQPTLGERPTYQNDIVNLFNFNPVIKFAGSKDLVNNCMPLLDDEDYTIFTVARKDGSSTWAGLVSQNPSGNAGQPGTTYILSTNDVGLNAINQGNTNVAVTDPATGQIMLRNTGAAGNISLSLNGGVVTASGTYPGNPTGTVKGYYIARHNATLSQSLIGNMAEVIAYRNGTLTADEINQIETYLAVKYGLSMNHNYVDADNTILWDITANAAFSNDIAGIGRDDVSTLNQKQSKSIGVDALVTMGNGSTIEVDNETNTNNFDDDQSYLIWGNDDGVFTTWENTNTLSGYSRLTRTWKVAETTALPVGAVKIQVPDDGSSEATKLPTEIGSVYFLVDDDGDFTNGGTTAVEMALVDTNWEVLNDFSNGEYFTFAISCPPLTISTQPVSVSVCPGVSTDFILEASGSNLTYQWQEDQGSGFVDLGGETNDILSIIPGGEYDYQVVITDDCGQIVTSDVASVTFLAQPMITTEPIDFTACEGNDALFSVVATGEGITYQWQEDQGTGFNDLVGENGASLTLSGVTIGMNGYTYQVVVSGTCTPVATSAVVTLTVNGAPTIVTQPVSTAVCAGQTAMFSVDGGVGVTYQWERSTNGGTSWSALGGATASTYTTPVNNATANGYLYRVKVTQPGCSTVTSNEVTLTVEGPVTISVDPANQTICAGDDVTFSVTANGGAGTLAYQWQEDTGSGFVDLGGETGSSLTLSSVTNANNGYQYQVLVSTGACSAITSAAATLTVQGPVTISVDPASQTICAGDDVTFSVTADGGAGTLAYQWQEDTGSGFVDLVGETGSSLTLSSVTNANNGYQYQVLVNTGSCDPVTSAAATLTVEGPVTISVDPASQTICAGDDVTFNVTADGGAGTLAYQWQEDTGSGFVDLGGETGSSLTLSSVTNSNNGYQYQVLVSTGACSAITSAAATLTVEGPVTISVDPASQTICAGDDVTFNVTADGGAGTLAYQWQEDTGSGFVDLGGETGSSLTLSSVTNANNGYLYQVLVSTGSCDPVTSAAATLTVEGPVTISVDPLSQTICAGDDVTFTVTADGGAGTLAYQWQEDTGSGFMDLVGETGSSLTLSSVTNANNGYQYQVLVSTGSCAAVASASATLTVEGPVTISVDPLSQTICAGDDVTFTVTADGGVGTLAYQWQEDTGSGFVDLGGETGSSLTLSSVTNANNGYQYQVMVSTGSCDPVTSAAATLTVEGPVTISVDPASQTICAGDDVTFNVTADGGAGTLAYQWQEDTGSGFVDLGGETGSSLTLSSVTNANNGYQYQVLVSTGSCDPVTSAAATLTVEGSVTISVDPASQTICAGDDVTFSVTADGGVGTLAYQWQEDTGGGFVDLGGETGSSLTLSSVTNANNGYQYQVLVSTGSCDPVTSAAATLTVEGPVTISVDPASQTICAGDDVTFSVTADGGAGTLAYQWQEDTGSGFVDLGGETGSSLTLSSVTNANNGYQYQVLVSTGSCDPVTSAAATLTVEGPVTISVDPASQTICAGDDVTFSVTADGGAGTLAYQWQEDTGSGFVDLGGETGSSLTLSSVTNANNGYQYQVLVSTGSCSAITSAAATLTVEGPVTISVDPASQTICSGDDVTFSVTADGGAGTLAYQWQEDTGSGFVDLGGETGSSLTLSSVTNANNGYQYRVLVSSGACVDITSAAGTLTVEGPVTISVDPASQTICAGDDVTFSVTADGGAGTLAYQWQEDTGGGFVDLGGETGSSLTLSSVTNANNGYQYQVLVSTGSCSAITSAAATLTVEGPVTISVDPASQTICAGDDVTFNVTADGGAGTLAYQWQEDTGGGFVDLGGETGSSLTLSSVTNANNGYQYRVMVSTGSCAPVASAAATLTVEGPVMITTQPTDQGVCDAQNATFSVVATGGSGTLSYQWQESTNGGSTWNNLIGETSTDLTLFAVVDAMNGYQYRVLVSTGACSAVASDAATLTVEGPVTISQQPVNTTVCSGEDVTFSIMASTPSGTLSYQWYRSTNGGGSYAPLVGETGNTLMLSAVTTSMTGYRYRVGYSTGACAEQLSNVAILTVEGPITITVQPQDKDICEGDDVTFNVTANAGSGTLSYQWQVKDSGGSTWADLGGETSASLTLTSAMVALDGNEYRVLLSSGACAEISSDSAMLAVSTGFTIDQQPVNVTNCAGQTVQFSVMLSGGGVTYQWERSTNGGSTWSPISLATTNILTLTNIQGSQNNNQYRVQINGGACGMATSSAATLTVEGPLAITTQPVSVTQCAGTDASFIAAGTAGAVSPGYQWELSTDGGTMWNPVPGATMGTLNVTGITAAMNGNLYRMAVSTSSCGTIYTNTVTLSVNGPVTVTMHPAPLTVCVTQMAMFEAAATNDGGGGLVYQWQVSPDNVSFTNIADGAVYAGTSTATLTVLDAAGLDGMYYRLEFVGGLCDPIYSNSAQLTVDNSSPSGNAGSDETICGYPGVTFNLATASTMASFADGAISWTSSGTGTFNNANIIHPIYTPSAADISGGSVSLVLVVSGTGNCSGELVQDEMTLTFDVANAPTVNAGPNILVCTNDLPIDFASLDIPPVATNGTVTWTKPGSVTGTFNNVNLITPIFTPSMADISNNSVTLTMTVQGNGGACAGVQLSDAITISFTGDNVLSAVLSTTDPTTICSGESIDVVIDIVGGTPPYNVAYTDGTSQFMIENYDNGSNLTLSPTMNAVYELVYVEDAINCPSITVSGTVPVTVEGPVVISSNPMDSTICLGGNASFMVVASEGNAGVLMYQWEVSTDNGSNWNTIIDDALYSGSNSDVLTLTGATVSNDGDQYRVQVSTGACSAVASAAATLTVEGPVVITTNPLNATICEAGNATFMVAATGGTGTLMYQWEESTDGGGNWNPVTDGGIYSGTTTNELTLSTVGTTNDTYQYRAMVSTGACNSVASSGATLTVEGPIDLSSEPVASTICFGENTSFSVTATGGSGTVAYQWEESTDNGSSWNTLTDGGIYGGVLTNTLMLTAVPASNDGYQYRVQVSTGTCSGTVSGEVLLTVNNVNTTGLTLSLSNECGDDEVIATLTGSLADDTFDLIYDLSGANTATGETATVTMSGGTGSFIIPFADLPNIGTTTVTITEVTAQSTSCSAESLSISADTDIGECDILLSLKVFLQGPYVSASGMMHDSLRAHAILPVEEPYTGLGFTHVGGGGGEMVPMTMFDLPVNPEDAIVDWVLIELRDAGDPSIVIATRAALLQRDGDVVDINGESGIRFAMDYGNYYVAIRHRNHLGAMTKVAYGLTNTTALIDFTNPLTETYGTYAQKEVKPGVMGLWGGNADHNSQIIYVGSGTDVTALSITVLLDPGNAGVFSSSYPVNKYHAGDLNMDGKVVYVGAGTDQTVISLNVLLHPLNSSFSSSQPIMEQLP